MNNPQSPTPALAPMPKTVEGLPDLLRVIVEMESLVYQSELGKDSIRVMKAAYSRIAQLEKELKTSSWLLKQGVEELRKNAAPQADAPDYSILPCPFCGSKDVDSEFASVQISDGVFRTEPGCMECEATAPTILKWNRRAPLAPQDPLPESEQAWCGDCKAPMQQQGPGKFKCLHCEWSQHYREENQVLRAKINALENLGLDTCEKCLTPNCENYRHQGRFVGNLCSPCHIYLKYGSGEHSQAVRNHFDLLDKTKKADELRAIIKQQDRKMEDIIEIGSKLDERISFYDKGVTRMQQEWRNAAASLGAGKGEA